MMQVAVPHHGVQEEEEGQGVQEDANRKDAEDFLGSYLTINDYLPNPPTRERESGPPPPSTAHLGVVEFLHDHLKLPKEVCARTRRCDDDHHQRATPPRAAKPTSRWRRMRNRGTPLARARKRP